MFRYKLYAADGDEIGEATYPQMIKLDDELHFGGGRKFRVLNIVPFDEEEESEFVGMLMVEAA